MNGFVYYLFICFLERKNSTFGDRVGDIFKTYLCLDRRNYSVGKYFPYVQGRREKFCH